MSKRLVSSGRRGVQNWIILLAILILAELFVFAKLPAALFSGEVPLNPLGWFGYGELQQVTVDRRVYPVAYWLNVLLLTLMGVIFGFFIYVVAFRSIS
jgi:hypothetical protein